MESKPQIPMPRSVGGDEPGSARIGPYHVVRHLVAGPGAQILEAAADSGEQLMLQIVRCRAARSSAEEIERKEMFESIRVATEELAADVGILQHGAAEVNGETILYWALPWDDRAVELGLAKIDDDDELVSVGILLAKRLTTLHQTGRLDPLLSERVLVIKNGEPWIAAAPLPVPDRWLSPGMRPPRLAPEETLAKEPTAQGDVWRLGQTLKALTVYLERLPTRVWRALELLGHPDVGVRIRTAAEALAMMESLADPQAPDPPSISDLTSAQSPIERTIPDTPIPDVDNAITIADEPLAAGERRLIEDFETQPGAKPPRMSRSPLPETETLVDFQMYAEHGEDVVVLEPADVLDHGFMEARTAGTEPASAYSDDKHPTLAEAVIPKMRKKRGTWEPAPNNEPAGPTGTVLGPKLPQSWAKRSTTTLPGVRRIEPAALPRMLPPPGGMLAGPKGTLIGANPVGPHQIMRVPRPVVSTPPEDAGVADPAVQAVEEPEEDDDGLKIEPVPSPRTAAIAVLTFILGLLIGAVASKGLRLLDDDPTLLSGSITIPANNTVKLDAQPAASALVISEDDGRVLGSTPMWFELPPSMQPAVLVAAPGHDPIRVVLPARGRLDVTLEPRWQDHETCLMNLHVPRNVPVESVGSSIEETSAGFQVPGAGVIRAVGEIRGAWLLSCPSLGSEDVVTLAGRPLETEVELRVSTPPDMEVWIDGEAAGTSPLRKRVRSGFKQLRIRSAQGDTLERWVPVFNDTDVELPDPKRVQ